MCGSSLVSVPSGRTAMLVLKVGQTGLLERTIREGVYIYVLSRGAPTAIVERSLTITLPTHAG